MAAPYLEREVRRIRRSRSSRSTHLTEGYKKLDHFGAMVGLLEQEEHKACIVHIPDVQENFRETTELLMRTTF